MTRRGLGEGSIYPRQDGRWEGAVHVGYEGNRRVRRFAIGHSRKDVADKLALLQQARDERRPIPDQRQKLGPFLRRWLDEVAKPTIRASTYSSYDDILKLHLIPGLGRIAVAKLTPAEVQAFLNAKLASGLSPRRVHQSGRDDCASIRPPRPLNLSAESRRLSRHARHRTPAPTQTSPIGEQGRTPPDADHGISPVLITESPQVIARTGTSEV